MHAINENFPIESLETAVQNFWTTVRTWQPAPANVKGSKTPKPRDRPGDQGQAGPLADA